MPADPATMIATIEGTLAQLYSKLHKMLSQKDRSALLQEISVLENSRSMWKRELAANNGSRPRVSSIDLTGGV